MQTWTLVTASHRYTLMQFEIYNIPSYFFTSSALGMDGVAPGLETAMEEAFAAILSASWMDLPSITAAMKYPVNVSPAAVVSTAFTLKIPWNTFSFPAVEADDFLHSC